MRILDWYIGRTIIVHGLLVMGVLVGLFTFVTFIDQMEDLGVGRYDLYDVVRYVVLTIPKRIYELFPMASLLGTILGLSSMAAESELIVMRAAGISLLRIVGSIMKVGALFIIASLLIGEVVTPVTETEAQRGRAEALQQSVTQQTDYGLWMRDHNTFVSVGEVLPDFTLLDIRVLEFDETRHMRSVVKAAAGRFEDGEWKLQRVSQTLFEGERVHAVQTEAAAWSSVLVPDILSVFLVRPDQLSAWHLKRYIAHLHDNAQETTRYELAYWQKVVAPFAVATMVLLAVPFVFGQLRSGSFGRNLFLGIMVGLGFFLANRGFGYMVLVYDIHPFIGAALPTVAFGAGAMFMMRRVS